MTPVQGPRPWWIAAALAPALLVLLDLALQAWGPPVPPALRWALLLGALVAAPALLWSAGLRRMRASEAGTPPEVAQAAADVAEARRALQEAMAGIARADAARPPAAPADASPLPARRGPALFAWGVVFFLLVSGGLAYAFLQVPEENVPSSTNPLHIHATFAVFVRGERVNFSGPEFDLSTRGFLISHLHSPDQDLLHLEGQRGQRFSDALARATGTQFDATFVSVDAPVAVRYDAAPGEKVRLFVAAHGEEEWREVENLLGYVPLDQDRILLTLGAVDSAGLAAQQGAVKAGAATLAQRAPWAGRDGRKKWDREGVSDRGHAGAVNDDLVEEVERREGGAAACGNDIHGKEVELRDLVVHENQSLATHPGNGMRVLQ